MSDSSDFIGVLLDGSEGDIVYIDTFSGGGRVIEILSSEKADTIAKALREASNV